MQVMDLIKKNLVSPTTQNMLKITGIIETQFYNKSNKIQVFPDFC